MVKLDNVALISLPQKSSDSVLSLSVISVGITDDEDSDSVGDDHDEDLAVLRTALALVGDSVVDTLVVAGGELEEAMFLTETAMINV